MLSQGRAELVQLGVAPSEDTGRVGAGAGGLGTDSTPEVVPPAPSGGGDFGDGQPANAYIRQCPGEVPAVVKEMGLTRLIPLSVKEHIWRKEYIDIFTLLEVRVAVLDLKAEKEEDKDKKRVRPERNIANWGQAFRTMACIIIEKFPECAGALWLYEYSIHAAHANYQGDARSESVV